MKRSSLIAQIPLWFLCPLCLQVPAAAQDIATAEALFQRGLVDMQAGRYDTGCKAIAESQRIDPRPGTLFTLAFCESKSGRVATAIARFGDYLSLVDALPPAQRAQQRERPKAARQERERLAPLVPELSLLLPPGAPAGTVVRRDGQVLGEAALGIGLPVDPGEHVLSTHVPGGFIREQRIVIEQGEKRQVTLEVQAAPEAGASPASPAPAVPRGPVVAPRTAAPTLPAPSLPLGADAPPAVRRTAVYVSGGVGMAGLVLGGVMGALTFGKKAVVEKHCGSGIGFYDAAGCDATGLDAANSGQTMGLLSTIGMGVGLAGLGTAAVLYWTEPKPANTATNAVPRSIRIDVFAAGPGGAKLRAEGVW
ncbi:hypothetical protein [Sorangium sp. So ce1153]|uniref:hypothetical protein n=1 Tax=Sorangium sp. So ce1153 TaxID=3133333 RepID=UPI003F5F7D85